MKKLIATSLLAFTGLSLQAQERNIEFVEYDLDNGMHVILHEDKSTPIVAVSIMYHVGSKNENPERTGFAHFFEHLLFEGSENIERGEYSEIVEKNGGTLNANTSQDRTYYYEILPSNQLELGMWLESERLFHANVDQQGVETQREVVKEEKRQRIDNQPYASFMGVAFDKVFDEHPYSWIPIGSMEHLDAAQEEDYINFYKTFYVPANAVLSIAGDISIEETKVLVDKYFASIPKGQAINLLRDVEKLEEADFIEKYKVSNTEFNMVDLSKSSAEARKLIKKYENIETVIPRPTVKEKPLTTVTVDTVYDNIQLPAVFMAYRGPANNTKDGYALQMINDILSSGTSSRMNKKIVEKDALAVAAFSFAFPLEDPGMVVTAGIASKDVDLADLQAALDAEIEKAQTELVSEEEFQKIKNQYENQFYSSNGSIAGIAENLANNYMYYGNTDLINSELEVYNEITREDLMEVAKKYFTKDARVILHYLPKQQ
ncbi:MAG: M16 family metallopeptidase [Lishizhenia sp.]